MKNVLSSRTGSYDVLQKLGIKGVEIGPPAPENVDKVKAELSKHGLTCMSVAGGIDLVNEDGVEKFDTLLNGAINMGAKIIFVSAKYGYMERPVVPAALRLLGPLPFADRPLSADDATYYLSKLELTPGPADTMAPWRKRLFIATSHITADAAGHFGLPLDRTVIIGSRIEV